MLHTALAGLALAGVVLVGRGVLGVGELVTLWLLVTAFVGQLGQVSHQLPELQAGLGALSRIRSLLTAPQEPRGGAPVPPGPAALELRDLDFGYGGGFALRSLSLTVPAGTTCALVGRSGAGKSTLVKLLSRAVEPPPGSVLVGGQDVTATDVEQLRRAVGVVHPAHRAARGDPDGEHHAVRRGAAGRRRAGGRRARTDVVGRRAAAGPAHAAGHRRHRRCRRGRSSSSPSPGCSCATWPWWCSTRPPPAWTRRPSDRVSRAAERLLAGRTGIVVAHRLSTIRWCDAVAVLDGGRLVQHGPRELLSAQPGPFRELLRAAGDEPTGPARALGDDLLSRGEARAPKAAAAAVRPSLTRTVWDLLVAHARWGLVGAAMFGVATVLGTYGTVTGLLWGRLVAGLERGEQPWLEASLLAVGLVLAPVAVACAFGTYPLWWGAVTLRLRLAVLRGQTSQQRLARTPPGEVAARALDTDRLVIYADRWVDVGIGAAVVVATALAGRSLLAGAVATAVLVLSALVSTAGAPLAGTSAREAGDLRASFGRSLVSALDAVRTVKLAAATAAVQGHLEQVDARRVRASVRENSVRTLLDGVPGILVQAGVVTAWVAHLLGTWDLATALLVTTAVSGFGWFGTVAGAAITEVPVANRWLEAAAALAGTGSLVAVPRGVDLVSGAAPAPAEAPRVPLQRLTLQGLAAVHDDGTVGVRDVDLTVDAGALVLLVGQVGSGKSSLLAALAGLVDHEGRISWNDRDVDDPQSFLRPGQVAYVGQVPRVLSGSFADNVTLDHDRAVATALDDARMASDVEEAGGHAALVGHRGVRLSGGQVQRLALARALATGAELLVADDVSSALDARTEVELWEALRRRGTTVLGSTSKRSALARADCVVVLEQGRVAAVGSWTELAGSWGHLAG